MPQQHQENSARTLFDTVLPEDARVEFFRPTRERIPVYPPPPQKPPAPDSARFWWHPAAGWLLALVAVVAVVAISWPSSEKRAKAQQESAQASREAEAKARQALKALRSPSPAPVVQPAPMPAQPVSRPPVEQTRLVRAPAPRATLLRLPAQELGVYKWYGLPAEWMGGSVWARYCGTVEHFSQIPPNPVPGDLWNVIETGASWIYCVPIGYNHPIWIDP
jgi:hypothetical protein